MPTPGPWIQEPDVDAPTRFLTRQLRSRTGSYIHYDNTYPTATWWTNPAGAGSPPWEPDDGWRSWTFPQLKAMHEDPLGSESMPFYTTWTPERVGGDPWTHHGYFDLKPGSPELGHVWDAEQAGPVLGSFQITTRNPVPDVPPPGAIGVEVDGAETYISRQARVLLAAAGTSPFTTSVKLATLDDFTITGPWTDSRPGNTGHVNRGASTVFRTPYVQGSQQALWPSQTHASSGDTSATLVFDLDLAEDWIGFLPTLGWFDSQLTPGESGSWRADILAINITTTYRPPKYRWIYPTPSKGMWNLRQRQSLTGNAGGWPLRQRQTGGATGSWPLRQRQTGT